MGPQGKHTFDIENTRSLIGGMVTVVYYHGLFERSF